MNWSVPRIWEGGDVWIIGGGPSIPKQFGISDEVIQKVIAGSSSPNVYSPYMSALHNKHVIGINVAYLIGNWIDMIFFGDGGFFLQHQQELANFPGLRVSCNPTTRNLNWVKFLEQDRRHVLGISASPKMVSWNHNSGAAAISLAAHTGAKRIFLLGFDMKLDNKSNKHWHDVYKMGTIEGKRKMHLPFNRHLKGFTQIAKDAKSMGIDIINVCPDSAITQFPKLSIKEVL